MEHAKLRTEKDRQATEQALLKALGEVVAESGFEQLKVNTVAERAGVSKVLIYRYFGSLDGLIAAYVEAHDFWMNQRPELPAKRKHLAAFLKALFRAQVIHLRRDVTLRRLCRWELSSSPAVVAALRQQREAAGQWLVEAVAALTERSTAEVAALVAMLSASASHLALLEETTPTYLGLTLQQPAGWEHYVRGVEEVIDLWVEDSLARRKSKAKGA